VRPECRAKVVLAEVGIYDPALLRRWHACCCGMPQSGGAFMFTRHSMVLVLGVALAGGACSSEPKVQPRMAAQPKKAWRPSEPKMPLPKEMDRGTRGSIRVDEEIARRCNLPTAHFEFDSSALSPSAAQALDALGACFTTGPLKGRSMKIVGHADPRGAGSVAQYLEQKGLESDRLLTSSMGELEATGHDESGWAADRKVEILLGS
jgi:peptidoglycan-associated lipoprotein